MRRGSPEPGRGECRFVVEKTFLTRPIVREAQKSTIAGENGIRELDKPAFWLGLRDPSWGGQGPPWNLLLRPSFRQGGTLGPLGRRPCPSRFLAMGGRFIRVKRSMSHFRLEWGNGPRRGTTWASAIYGAERGFNNCG